MIALKAHSLGTVLPVKAQPGARRDALLGEHAEALRVAVTAPPERGKANEAIAALLSRALKLKGSRVTLLSGEAARDKRFLIRGLEPDDVRGRLQEILGET